MPIGRVLLNLIIILAAAKVVSELFERFGQPAVLGELVAGVLIGGSLLGWVQLDDYIEVLAEIGVIILIFEVGLELELKELMRMGRSSFLVAVIGVVLPFFLGYYCCKLLNVAGGSTEVAIFMGASITATSIGITARVLADLGKLQLDESKIILGAAVMDDVMGLVILATVVGILQTHTVEVANILRLAGLAIVFLVGALVVGAVVTPHLMKLIDRMRVRGVIFVASFLWCLFLAFVAHEIGLATIVGAFAAGLVVEKATPQVSIGKLIRPVAAIFIPIFFVKMGMMVNLRAFLEPRTLLLAAVLTIMAIIGKVVCGWGGLGKRLNKLSIGLGMIPRGEVGLIFASHGMVHSVITESVYSAIIVMVMVTTFITPPLLKLSLTHGERRLR
ncbi:MAG: cation:proton antiporter [bacterium]